jgi:uncharacterized paraquat-inducible protein A
MMRQALPCPTCGDVIDVDNPSVGQELACPWCHEAFVIHTLRPLTLRYAAYGDEQTEDVDDGANAL